MRCRVEILDTFKREFKRLSKRYPSLLEDVKGLHAELLANPKLGTDLGGGLRKIRMRIASKASYISMIRQSVAASVKESLKSCSAPAVFKGY